MAEPTRPRPTGRHTDVVELNRRTLLSLLLEVGLIAALLALYRAGRSLSRGRIDEAERNASRLWHVERVLHLPSEADVQAVLLRSQWLVHAADRYYVGVHFPLTALFLAWLWLRHHDRYARIRNTLVLTTMVALVVTVLLPLAPPRLFGGDDLVDTMQTFGPSAYNGDTTAGLANQYAAMPSLHIAWSVLVGVSVVLVSTRRVRWLVLAHPAITTFVVIGTANHYWADGAVGVLILGVCAAAVYRPPWLVRPLASVSLPVARATATSLASLGAVSAGAPTAAIRRATGAPARGAVAPAGSTRSSGPAREVRHRPGS